MDLEKLVRYKIWANDLLFKATATLDDATIQAPQKIVFGSLINTLNHVYTVDLIFKAHLSNQHHGLTTRRPTTSPPLAELRELQSSVDHWYLEYAANLDADMRDDVVNFEFVGGGQGVMTREEIIQHVVNHGTYHRGHIGTMFYEIPATPPTTDLPVFLREHR